MAGASSLGPALLCGPPCHLLQGGVKRQVLEGPTGQEPRTTWKGPQPGRGRPCHRPRWPWAGSDPDGKFWNFRLFEGHGASELDVKGPGETKAQQPQPTAGNLQSAFRALSTPQQAAAFGPSGN